MEDDGENAPTPDEDGEGVGGEGVDGEGADGGSDAALRRQQLFVGSGVAALGGIAVIVAAVQRFPGFPFVAYLAAGLVTTGLLFALLFASVFRDGE